MSPMSLQFVGAQKYADLSRDLKKAGSDLRKEIPKGMRKAAKPLILDVRASALDVLPHEGGFAAYVAKSSIRVSTRKDGVRLVGRRTKGKGMVNLPAVNAGRIRHPVYGHRNEWVSQSIAPGFWDKAMDKGAEHCRKAMLDVIDQIAAAYARGG